MASKTPSPLRRARGFSWGTLLTEPDTPLPQYESLSFTLPSAEKPVGRRSWARYGRKATWIALLGGVIALLLLVQVMLHPMENIGIGFAVKREVEDKFAPAKFVRGEPTESYYDNLKPEVKYITTFVGAGWTNDVMSLANMLYLAQLTERVPLLPPFAPSHLPRSAGTIPFSQVFDIPHLARAMNMPVLEWSDVKASNSSTLDSMGCWSAWMGTEEGNAPHGSHIPEELGLDVSYTSTPLSAKLRQQKNPHLAIQRLMPLAFPSGRQSALTHRTPLPSPIRQEQLEPSDHLLCFDFLYYLSYDMDYEWERDWSPQWRLVGKHLRWARGMRELAEQYVNRHFGLPEKGPVPPYIAAHVRRGDFKKACPEKTVACLATTKQLQRRIDEVKLGLLQEKGVNTSLVLITSDETDPAWWSEVAALGYTWIDHTELKTDELYGKWYSPILDAVFQSMALGFVGTDGSTFSLLAERRVRDWNGGLTGRLKWRGVPAEEL